MAISVPNHTLTADAEPRQQNTMSSPSRPDSLPALSQLLDELRRSERAIDPAQVRSLGKALLSNAAGSIAVGLLHLLAHLGRRRQT